MKGLFAELSVTSLKMNIQMYKEDLKNCKSVDGRVLLMNSLELIGEELFRRGVF